MSMTAVLPMRERAQSIQANLEARLAQVLPKAMREADIDMWVILCQEDNLDPVYTTLIPMDTWCPILQMLVFHDRGDAGIEGINISGTDTKGLYARPYRGQKPEEQWPVLRQLIQERNPRRIGINIGSVQWAAGGLTQNLYGQLMANLPDGYHDRLVSAEPLIVQWLATLTQSDIETFRHVVEVAKAILARCYSREAIEPGVTTTTDLEWFYWQTCADLGLEVSFRPFFTIHRSPASCAVHDPSDRIIMQGDLLHCDVGIKYLRLNSDHQQWAYVLRNGETDAPAGFQALMRSANRLQDIFMAEFRRGLTGNEMLANILARARGPQPSPSECGGLPESPPPGTGPQPVSPPLSRGRLTEGVPEPRVYSHSLGYFLHEPGPLIGLPWEQDNCGDRGNVILDYGQVFTMELSVTDSIPEWDGARLRLSMEEDVVFTHEGCRVVGARQERPLLI